MSNMEHSDEKLLCNNFKKVLHTGHEYELQLMQQFFAGITCVSEHKCQCKDSHILFYGNLLFQEQNLQLTENFTIKALYK